MRRLRSAINSWCADFFERYDILLTPTVPYDAPPARGPFLAELEGRRQPGANFGSFTMPFNLSWHPAATVRAGLSSAGLPVGLQIVGPGLRTPYRLLRYLADGLRSMTSLHDLQTPALL